MRDCNLNSLEHRQQQCRDDTPAVSIIIPTLNEATTIEGMLAATARVSGSHEVIVADGGSTDETVEIARRCGARVVLAQKGRGPQMAAGARAARGEAFWFLHADTLPPVEGVLLIQEALKRPEVAGGNFRLQFDGKRLAGRILGALHPLTDPVKLCYGDSGIFVRRSAYEACGGFSDYPLFEDLDLVHRLLRTGRFVHLPGKVTTSARRFEQGSIVLTFCQWTVLLTLYLLGVSPHRLSRLYAPIRAAQPRR